MDETTLFEVEEPRSRADIARVLRSLAAEFENDGPVRIGDGDQSVLLDPPERPTFELEIERESDGDTAETSIELEIEWTEPVGETEDSATNEGDAVTVDSELAPHEVASLGRFEVFRDRADEWRWRLVHRNGNIIATSGEGYTSRQNAVKGMHSVMRNAPDAEVVSK